MWAASFRDCPRGVLCFAGTTPGLLDRVATTVLGLAATAGVLSQPGMAATSPGVAATCQSRRFQCSTSRRSAWRETVRPPDDDLVDSLISGVRRSEMVLRAPFLSRDADSVEIHSETCRGPRNAVRWLDGPTQLAMDSSSRKGVEVTWALCEDMCPLWFLQAGPVSGLWQGSSRCSRSTRCVS